MSGATGRKTSDARNGGVTKGEETRRAVLQAAIAQASVVGINGVTIGALAEQVGLSKSGLFAHFRSKESLQLAILDAAVERFVAEVIAPALREPRGEPRVRALLDGWWRWSRADFMPGGCIFVAAIAEMDDIDGVVRDRLVASQQDWIDTLAQAIRLAVHEHHFRADLDAEQMAHEFVTLAYGHHLLSRLFRDSKQVTSLEKRIQRAMKRLFVSAAQAS